LRRLRLRAQSPPCEGQTARADQGRGAGRGAALVRRGVRDHRRWRAEVFQEGARPLPDRRGNRRPRDV